MRATTTWRGAVLAIASMGSAACASSAPPAAAEPDLTRRIADTTWEWSGDYGPITFGRDGYCRHADWDRRGLVTSWKAIDEHAVLLTIERGRDTDRYALCVFSDDFSQYAGFNFHGLQKIDVSRPIRPN